MWFLFDALLSVYRSGRRKATPYESHGSADEPLDNGEIGRVTQRSLIADAIAALKPQHRDVIAAAYWEGLSTKEIAARLGIPDGTVKSRLHYALRRLRAHLQELEIIK